MPPNSVDKCATKIAHLFTVTLSMQRKAHLLIQKIIKLDQGQQVSSYDSSASKYSLFHNYSIPPL